MSGCSSDETQVETPDPTPVKAALTSIQIEDESLSQTSASLAVKFSTADQIYYACVEGSTSTFDSESFSSVSVSQSDVELVIDLDNLTASTSYSVGVYASNEDGDSDIKTLEFTTLDEVITAPMVTLALSDDGLSIEASVINTTKLFYTIYKLGQESSEPTWTEVELSADSYSIAIDELMWGSYTIEAYATDAEGVESETISLEFEIAMPDVDSFFTVANVTVSPLFINVDIDIDESVCEYVAFTAVDSSSFSVSAFTDALASGYIDTIVTEDRTITVDNGYNLSPGSDYTIAAVAITITGSSVNAWGQTVYEYAAIGDIYVEEFTTEALEIGVSDETVTLSVDESTITLTAMTVTVGSVDGVSNYLFGYTESSNITGGDLDAWLVSSGWLNNPYIGINSFDGAESFDMELYNLDDDTEYTIYAIGVSPEGYLGDVVSLKESTNGITSNPNVEYSVNITPGMEYADFEVTFGNECTQVHYYNTQYNQYTTDADIEKILLGYIGTEYNLLTLESATDGVLPFTLSHLSMSKDYIFYSMGVDANGGVSALQKHEYSTTTPTYDSEASLTLTPTNVVYDSDNDNVKITLGIEMTNDAVKYYYAVFDDYIADKTDMAAYGAALFIAWDHKLSAAPMVDITLYGDDYIAVFIPVDSTGNFGTPIKYAYDGWE